MDNEILQQTIKIRDAFKEIINSDKFADVYITFLEQKALTEYQIELLKNSESFNVDTLRKLEFSKKMFAGCLECLRLYKDILVQEMRMS